MEMRPEEALRALLVLIQQKWGVPGEQDRLLLPILPHRVRHLLDRLALLTLAAVSGTIQGSFTAPSPAPTNYLVIRTTSATAPTAPTNGTSYANGASALGGYIVSNNTTTGFTDAAIGSSTAYWYWVYSYNNTNCSGGPLYSSTNITNNITSGAILFWAGLGSTIQQNTSVAFNTAGNWSSTGATYTATSAVPSTAYDVVMNLNGTAAAAYTISATTAMNSFTLNYTSALTTARTVSLTTGAFAVSTVGGFTIYNANTGSAVATLNVVVSATGSLAVGGDLTLINKAGAAANVTEILNSHTVTVGGTTTTSSRTGQGGNIQLLGSTAGATYTFNGTAILDDGNSTVASSDAVAIGALTSTLANTYTFNGNLNT